MTTNKGEYVPSAKSKVKSTVFGFGALNTGNTETVLSTAKGSVTSAPVVHDASSYPVFTGGTENYFGPVITIAGGNTKINNITNDAVKIPSNLSKPEYHTRKKGRVHGVTSVNILTGAVTYNTLQGSGYVLNSSGGTRDTHVDAIMNPYTVPARLTYLGGKAPVSSSFNPLTEGV